VGPYVTSVCKYVLKSNQGVSSSLSHKGVPGSYVTSGGKWVLNSHQGQVGSYVTSVGKWVRMSHQTVSGSVYHIKG
jgi:hypothetical protein